MDAKLLRFYGGLSVLDLGNMPAHRKRSLWKAIDAIEAQESLNLIRCLCYINMKPADREAFDSKLKNAAYPSEIYQVTEETSVPLKDSFLMKLKGRFSGK